MKIGIKLNLQKVLDDIATFTDGFDISFDNVSNLTGWSDDHAPFIASDVKNLNFYGDNQDIYLLIITEETSEELVGDNITDVSTNGNSISFTCEIMDNEMNQVLDFINKGYIELNQFGKTSIIAYRLNDERNKLSKTLTPVTILDGNFKAPLGIKTLEIDVIDYDIDNSYNYVYIPKLSRFYYVTNIQLSTKDYTKLLLQEDVLQSHASLIRSQNAFVTRYGGSINVLLYDDRYPLIDETNISYITPGNITGSNVKQFKLVMDTIPGSIERAPNVFMKATCDMLTLTDSSQDISAPTGSGLPNIQSKRHAQEREYLMNINTLGQVVRACINNNAPASFIHSVLLLPFDLRDIFSDETSGNYIYVGDKVLASGNEWKSMNETTGAPTCFMTKQGGSPYIKVADFNFNATGNITLDYNYRDYSPVTQWEIYLPFVGWQTLNPATVIGKRIQVYYTFDFDTGLSTCFLYNYTDEKIIWSGSCEIGMKMTLATTNANELAIQKNATSLNLIMGLLTGAISTVIGAKTGHASQVGSGIGGMVGNVVTAINSYNSLIERAQITYGTSDNALYSPMEVVIRKTTHAKLITTTDEENRYKELNGLPYKQYVALSSLTTGNYIEVGEIHFNANGNNIYQTEIDEIVALLKNGVIL